MVPTNKYRIMDYDRFSMSARGLFEPPYYKFGGRHGVSCYQNPTKAELRAGIYKPRLTLTKRIENNNFAIPLKIELSLPKCLFKNNFDELTDSDFTYLSKGLVETLGDMGVDMLHKHLVSSPLSAVHYSKNIALTDYTSTTMVLRELEKVDLTKRLEMAHRRYNNGGHCLYYHANSFQVVFYDKIKELEHARISSKRCMEKDNEIQMHLFEPLRKKRPFEVVRMEVRLNKRGKIRSTLKRLGFGEDVSFGALFNKDISQAVLKDCWHSVELGMPFMKQTPTDFFEHIIKHNPNTGITRALKHLAVSVLIEDVGVRGLRGVLEAQGKDNHYWYKFIKQYKGLHIGTASFEAMKHIGDAIDTFEPLRLRRIYDEDMRVSEHVYPTEPKYSYPQTKVDV